MIKLLLEHPPIFEGCFSLQEYLDSKVLDQATLEKASEGFGVCKAEIVSEYVDLMRKNNKPIELFDLHFQDEDFSGLDLSGVSFNQVIFESCKFYETNLQNTIFLEARFIKVDFYKVNLEKSKLKDAALYMTNFINVNLRESNLENISLEIILTLIESGRFLADNPDCLNILLKSDEEYAQYREECDYNLPEKNEEYILDLFEASANFEKITTKFAGSDLTGSSLVNIQFDANWVGCIMPNGSQCATNKEMNRFIANDKEF